MGGGYSERVAVYDWVRLFATIFVVIGHSTYLNIQTTYGGVAYELPDNLNALYYSRGLSWIRWLAGWVYEFHMPLFFMLSGAVMGLRPIGTFDKVVRSKVKRLLIPYFVYGCLFMLPVKRMGNFYSNDTLKEAFGGFLQGIDSGHLWFLTALFWCMIVFVTYVKALEHFHIHSIYILLLLGGLTPLLFSYLPLDVLGLKNGLRYMIYFALGYVFECERHANKQWNIKQTAAAYIIMLIFEILQHKYYGLLSNFFVIMVGSFMTYLFSDLCDRFFKRATEYKLWKFIIRNLFYVYLFHDPMEYIVLRLFMGRGWLSSGMGCIAYTFCRTVGIFCLTLCMGEMVYFIKDKIGKLMTGVNLERKV